MNYLRNSWYCAGWSDELTDEPLGRTMLDEYLVFYRGLDGRPIALAGRCPHRFAPLDQGITAGDTISCPYHGLCFDSDGTCIRNPHGNGHIPRKARLRKYPIAENCGVLWVWMGDPDQADQALLPQQDYLVNPSYSARTGYVKMDANYQLVIDNLLDLSHAPFLHSKTLFGRGSGEKLQHSFRIEGQVVHSDYFQERSSPSPLMQNLFPDAEGELHASMAWAPGSNLNFDLALRPIGSGGKGGLHMPSYHYLVPETERTTHYFAAIARDVNINDTQEDERMIGLIYEAFTEEDAPMIRACQELMGTTDLMSLDPAVLQSDVAAMQVRRILKKLISDED